MKGYFTAVMAALVIAALFWGNCFSCPQLLLAAQKHGCCPHTKSTKTECQTQGLKHFVKAEKSVPVIPTAMPGIAVPAPVSEYIAKVQAPVVNGHAPPDTLPLRI